MKALPVRFPDARCSRSYQNQSSVLVQFSHTEMICLAKVLSIATKASFSASVNSTVAENEKFCILYQIFAYPGMRRADAEKEVACPFDFETRAA